MRLLTFLLLCGLGSPPALAAFVSDYQASSGLFPNQISPPYTLFDNASPEQPTLSPTFLTISTSANAERMLYTHNEPIVDTSGAFYIEAKVRFVSGESDHTARAPISISFTTAPAFGNTLFIDQDQVFFLTADLTPGVKVAVDTDDAFHTYRITYNGANAFSLSYDLRPILAGTTFNDAGANGLQERIAWGQGSALAFGTAQWEYFQHNALAIPEPQSYAMLLAGLGLLGFVARRRTKHG